KAIIKNGVLADSTTKALYLLGRIPVPYSGTFDTLQNLPPDGHPQHSGAWPADIYYGCFNEGFWKDEQSDTMGSRTENWNLPGDGKFDPVYIFGNDSVVLQIGRVDLTNMPAFGMSDTLLVQQYLNKAHKFKTGQFNMARKGLVYDNFGPMGGEAFAATGWRDFTTMFSDSVFNTGYLTGIKQGNYLFSYGCGGGYYYSCNGIGNTSVFNNDSINTVFTMLFGSYFGDWDSQDDFLRAPLCSRPSALASMWSGRPHWHVHHMSLGENIGYCARLTQNNYWDTVFSVHGYIDNIYPTGIHIALMGDPSLRLHSMIPCPLVKAVTATDSLSVKITWKASADATDGYDILFARSMSGKFIPIGNALSADTTFTHLSPGYGMNYYMVRPRKLENTPSGTYYNLALGVIDSAYSKRAMGVEYLSGTKLDASVYPNPSNGVFAVYINDLSLQKYSLQCFDMTGRLLLEKTFSDDHTQMDISAFSKGIYFLKIKSGTMEVMKKIMVE
ncbi:MAG: T9SS type A sorting domain-containing protein, partial [Bacteroidia bacterium]